MSSGTSTVENLKNTDPMKTLETCEVKSPTDIYPVVFYDQTVFPASDAARAVLYGK